MAILGAIGKTDSVLATGSARRGAIIGSGLDKRTFAKTALLGNGSQFCTGIVTRIYPPLGLQFQETAIVDPAGHGAQRQERKGLLKGIFWPIGVGTHQFSIECYHPGFTPTPSFVIKANPLIGLAADIVVSVASTPNTWITTSVSVTVTATGVLEVWRYVNSTNMNAMARWANIVAT